MNKIKLDIKKNGTCSYNLILIDQNMPIQDGLSATIEILKYITDLALPQPIIIGITGQLDESYINEATKGGMNMVLSKPIDGNKLKPIFRKL